MPSAMNTIYFQSVTQGCIEFRDSTVNQSQFWIYTFALPVFLCFAHFIYFIHKRGPNPEAVTGHFIHNASLHQSTHTNGIVALSLYVLLFATTVMQIDKARGTIASSQSCFYKLEGSGIDGEIGKREHRFTMWALNGGNVLNILAASIWARCVLESLSCLRKSYDPRGSERQEVKSTLNESSPIEPFPVTPTSVEPPTIGSYTS